MSSTAVVPSIIKCVADCEYNDRCKSVFYGDDDGTCTLCSEVFNYYAERPAVAPANTKHLRPLQGSCPEGWWSFQYSCYTLTTASTGFQHDECVAMGAHAVYVESIEEQHFLAYTMKPATGERDLFLGYMKINNTLYLAGTLTLPTFTYFASGEGILAFERCVFFRSTQWADCSCGKNSKTVCEIEL
ncbi:CLC4E-like protein [Mya arenaria]|uniref:CLC4E-like protein n=1 Tax=Mya arenaria TaxID=6604 RepID=A0ABY7EG86_MYAAR|nr:C-type lectin domain family 4 member E-like [Mya arenaria]WAR08895.1 CLC4E-like protein [Mya arenaria]